MKKILLSGLIIMLAANICLAETLTLSTYYPSPFGVFNQMRLVPLASEAGICNVNNNGLMYILNNGNPGQLKYCWGGNPAAVATTWIQIANDMYPADTANAALRVGIGTGVAAPAQKLHVLSAGPTIARFEGSAAAPKIEFAQANAPQGYIGSNGANPFYVENSGAAQQFTITQNGSVGIKTNPAVSILEVLGAGVGAAMARVRVRSMDNQAGISFSSNDNGEFTIYSPAGGNDLRFSSGGTDFLWMSAGPDSTVGLGTGPSIYKLDVRAAAAQNGFRFVSAAGTETFLMDAAGDLRLTGGDFYADAFFYNPSDITLKKNIKKAPGLAAIMKLEGISFDWKKSGESDLGVSAQNLEKVFPTLVHDDPTTHKKFVRYTGLIAPLIEAVKEQQKEIEELKKEVDELMLKESAAISNE